MTIILSQHSCKMVFFLLQKDVAKILKNYQFAKTFKLFFEKINLSRHPNNLTSIS